MTEATAQQRICKRGYTLVKDSRGGWYVVVGRGGEAHRSVAYRTRAHAEAAYRRRVLEWHDEWSALMDLYTDLELDPDTIEHLFRVRMLCRQFIAAGLDLDGEALLFAAGLHDIARILGKKRHHKKKRVNKVLKRYGIRKTVRNRYDDIGIYEIIKAHRKGFDPEDHTLEAAVLRISDKLDKFDKERLKNSGRKGFKKALKACKESMDLIYEDFDFADDLDTFESFHYVYKVLLRQKMAAYH